MSVAKKTFGVGLCGYHGFVVVAGCLLPINSQHKPLCTGFCYISADALVCTVQLHVVFLYEMTKLDLSVAGRSA